MALAWFTYTKWGSGLSLPFQSTDSIISLEKSDTKDSYEVGRPHIIFVRNCNAWPRTETPIYKYKRLK